jgi:hypothetical protein
MLVTGLMSWPEVVTKISIHGNGLQLQNTHTNYKSKMAESAPYMLTSKYQQMQQLHFP